MRLLHCGDFHLDSPLTTNLSGEKKKQRKNELLLSFVRIMEYADEHKIDAVLISGDLFDSEFVSVHTERIVKETVARYQKITVFYLPGNHDPKGFTKTEEQNPRNLIVFSEKWDYYRLGNVVIAGAVLTAKTRGELLSSFQVYPEDINIVMLHGQIAAYEDGKEDTIPLSELKNHSIDYLALGHVHRFQQFLLANGIGCYCGCPEGRGFDECGEKGFVIVHLDGKQIHPQFFPFAKRTVQERKVDITGAESTSEAAERIKASLSDCSAEDLVLISLCGTVSLSSEYHLPFLRKLFSEKYYAFSINDRAVKLSVSEKDYRYDLTLRGEYVRLVMKGSYTEEEKKILLELGLRALAGEEADTCF